jgi:uncharacterized protein (TIGR03435 family)
MWRVIMTVLVSMSVVAQVAGPTFEVASIKSSARTGRTGMEMNGDAGRRSYNNVGLINVIAIAYQVQENRISGPAWLASERYDIVARLPAGATGNQVPEMLQTLLRERFKVTLHKEPKILPVYALIIGKGGTKLQETDGEPIIQIVGRYPHHLLGRLPMGAFADVLSRDMDRPVVDMTGLKGVYEIDREWLGDEGSSRSMGQMRGPDGSARPEGGKGRSRDNSDSPSIFTALQEKFGLKLEPKKEPLDTLIIDHAEKVPTEN